MVKKHGPEFPEKCCLMVKINQDRLPSKEYPLDSATRAANQASMRTALSEEVEKKGRWKIWRAAAIYGVIMLLSA